MATHQKIAEHISALESCATDFEFPAGGNVPIPLDSEVALADVLRRESPLTTDVVSLTRHCISLNESYGCLVFTVRMSLLAVRSNDIELFRRGLLGLLFESGQVDDRDILGVLSITEFCAGRLGLDYGRELEALRGVCDDRLRTTVEGYLERQEEMRTIEALGFVAEERDEGLCIRSRV